MGHDLGVEHIHHMAKRVHHTQSKYDKVIAKLSGMTERAVRTVEVATGALLGGAVEGRTDGMSIVGVPVNLAAGVALAAAGYMDLAGDEWSQHLNNFGDGFLASYIAAKGYAFGDRWRKTGKVFGGGEAMKGHDPFARHEAVKGDLSQGQMDAIVARMQQAAAGAPAAH